MVSTVSYVPVVALVTTFVCWYAALTVIIAPSFLQVTVVAGPPVEVQVRDLVVPLYTSVVAVGTPEAKEKDLINTVSISTYAINVQRYKMRKDGL